MQSDARDIVGDEPLAVLLLPERLRSGDRRGRGVIVTEWDVCRAFDLKRLAGVMTAPVMVDLRNVYPLADAGKAGLAYSSIGR